MATSSTTRIRCDRPQRLAKSLVSRFSSTARAEWDSEEGRGHLLFRWERDAEVDMIAADTVLLIHLECEDEDLVHLEETIGRGVVELAAGGDVEVVWKRAGGEEGTRWATDGVGALD